MVQYARLTEEEKRQRKFAVGHRLSEILDGKLAHLKLSPATQALIGRLGISDLRGLASYRWGLVQQAGLPPNLGQEDPVSEKEKAEVEHVLSAYFAELVRLLERRE